VVLQSCNPSYLGGRARKIKVWALGCQDKSVRLYLKNKLKEKKKPGSMAQVVESKQKTKQNSIM
jgi:hypothetical protein